MKLQESSILTSVTQNMASRYGYEWFPENTPKTYDVIFSAISDFLSLVKSKERKTALVIRDLKGTFLLAGIVEYNKNENEDMPGNWSYYFTVTEEDVEDANVINETDVQFEKIVATNAYNLHNIVYKVSTYLHQINECLIITLLQWLDQNAKEGEEVTLEHDGYFIASVVVENGQKIISIVPDGAMKKIIKNDDALEE